MKKKAAHTNKPEYFTAFPNRYLDKIAPKLTDTQRAVCDVVIRYTSGYHRQSAYISNTTFMKMTGKSEPAIIRAKKQLEKMGLLLILRKGGGAKTTLYSLDIYYDTPKASQGPSEPPQETSEPTGHVTSETEEKAVYEPPEAPEEENDIIPETEEVEEDGVEIQDIPDPVEDTTTETEEQDYTNDEESAEEETEDVIEIQDDEEVKSDEISGEISGSHDMSGPVTVQDEDNPTPKSLSAPYNISKNIYYINNKTNNESTANEAEAQKKEKKQPKAAIVCSLRSAFFGIFPDADRNKKSWGFFGWAAKEYGLDMCLEKLRTLGEYYKDKTVGNPYGLFRNALTYDYQMPQRVVKKVKADISARAEAARWREKCKEHEQVVANFDYDAAQSHLQELMNSLGC